jgi:hypothetical protein
MVMSGALGAATISRHNIRLKISENNNKKRIRVVIFFLILVATSFLKLLFGLRNTGSQTKK